MNRELQEVLEASERLLKGYPPELTEEQRLKQNAKDGALCASFIQNLYAQGKLSAD